MIFVTVGTHEQAFDRLVKAADEIAGKLNEDMLIQTGYSTYEPKNARWTKLMAYQDMQQALRSARIVITHGGPSSFMEAIRCGRVPVVVPRQKKYNEHVNDHQKEFVQKIADTVAILPVYEVDKLEYVLTHYDELAAQKQLSNQDKSEMFSHELDRIVANLFKRK